MTDSLLDTQTEPSSATDDEVRVFSRFENWQQTRAPDPTDYHLT